MNAQEKLTIHKPGHTFLGYFVSYENVSKKCKDRFVFVLL